MPTSTPVRRLLTVLLAIVIALAGLAVLTPAEARNSVRSFSHIDRRGDAPKGFDIRRVDGYIDNNSLVVVTKIRGLKRWGRLQLGLESPDQQNLLTIFHDDYGDLKLTSFHRDAWTPFSKWYEIENCPGAKIIWKRGKSGRITTIIPLDTCAKIAGLAETNANLTLVTFKGAGPKRRDSVNSLSPGGW